MALWPIVASALLKPLEVDFALGPVRAPELVRQLAETTGRKLAVATTLENEVLFVSVKKVDPQRLLDKIAAILDANWVRHRDGFTLERPVSWPAIAAQRRSASFAAKIERNLAKIPPSKVIGDKELVQEALAERVRRDKENMSSERMMRFGSKTPAGRLLDAILLEVRPKGIARDPEHRVVFSNHPNRVQMPLPKSLDGKVAQFFIDHNRLVDEIEPQVAGNQKVWGRDNPLDAWRQVDPSEAKILVIVGGAKDPKVELKVYEKGRLAAIAYRYLNDFEPWKPTNRGKVALTAESKDFLKLRKPARSRDFILNAELRPAFQKCAENEFLVPVNREALEGIAARDGNVIALLPDQLIAQPFLAPTFAEVDLSMYEKLLGILHVERTESDGWIQFKSDYPQLRIDRRKLQDAFRLAEQEKGLSLRRWADVLAWNHAEQPLLLSSLLALGGFEPTEGQGSPFSLWLLSSLDDAQRATLRAGKGISAMDLKAEQRAIAELAVLNDHDLTTRIGPESDPRMREPGDLFSSEPTEFYPDGFRETCLLLVDLEEQPSFFLTALHSPRIFVADPGLLVRFAASKERPDLFPGEEALADPVNATFYSGVWAPIGIVYENGRSKTYAAEFTDERPDVLKPMKWSDLPDKLRADFEAGKKRLIASQEELKRQGRLGNGGKNAPPPAATMRG